MTTAITELSECVRHAITSAVGEAFASFLIAVDPKPQPRARVGRWGAYYPKTFQAYKTEVLERLEDLNAPSEDGLFILCVESVVQKPKTSKLSVPKGDVDNFAKAPLDALTRMSRIYTDDTNIVALWTTKRFAEPGEQPGTLIHWLKLET